MIRITKQADYAILVLTRMAREPLGRIFAARELALRFDLGVATAAKVLKGLVRGGLLKSHRGLKGGYSLARGPQEISLAEVVRAMEGPIAITECSGTEPSDCRTESLCGVAGHWQRINDAIVEALEGISLAELVMEPVALTPGGMGNSQNPPMEV